MDYEIPAGPLSPDEYASMLRVYRSGDIPEEGTKARDRWHVLTERWQALFPETLRREGFHEAGHIVVGHSMGWTVQRIERRDDGVPRAVVPPPDNLMSMRPLMPDQSTIRVAGYLAENRACGFAGAWEAVEVAKRVEGILRMQGIMGGPATAELRLGFVRAYEAYAFAILTEHWPAVAAIADLVMTALPVTREQLLEALADVEHGGAHTQGAPPAIPF